MSNANKKVVIIDYGLGNLFSVKQACQTVGMNVNISNIKAEILSADALILPGVGAFIEAMNNLEKLDLITAIKKVVSLGKPFFGICLGMQLIFTKSEEFGSGNGLNLLPGVIKKFPSEKNGNILKVPQIAWNNIYTGMQNWNDSPLLSISENEYMYFVHSYYVEPDNKDVVLTNTNYNGLEYCSAILQNNIFATQFHPEKSSEKGITIYKNWAIINKLI